MTYKYDVGDILAYKSVYANVTVHYLIEKVQGGIYYFRVLEENETSSAHKQSLEDARVRKVA